MVKIDVIEVDEARAAIVQEQESAPEAVANEAVEAGEELPRGATLTDDGAVLLKLKYPRTVKIKSSTGSIREERYDELTFHRLTGGDMNAISAATATTAATVAFARSTRIREAIMRVLYEQLDAYDIQNGAAIIEYFFGTGRKTGR